MTAKKWVADLCRGCTAVPDLHFSECCRQHDLDYENMKISRKDADKRFLDCMLATRKLKSIAYVYYLGVRIFGGLFWKERLDD